MMRLFHYIILLIGFLYSQEKIAFIKYFQNDRDFLGDKAMLASERIGENHIQVSYNEKKQAIIKEWMNQYGQPSKRELFSYDNEGRLHTRAIIENVDPAESLPKPLLKMFILNSRTYARKQNYCIYYAEHHAPCIISCITQLDYIKTITI